VSERKLRNFVGRALSKKRVQMLRFFLKKMILPLLLLPGLFLFLPAICPAAQNQDLTEFSIEELMDIKVTSVSKKSQRLSDSAAAIFVITREDIRRSGATSIPDALRMAPGVNVARIDANKWAVNCRGFNSRFSPSLQVLIDGRSVYSPSFSGVYWEATDVLLEDVDRIEVIRGPGATIWGSNAVNGVINIITRRANDTQGGFVQASAGSVEKNMVAARYGGSMGKEKFWRIYAKHRAGDEFNRLSGEDADDDWQINQAGFRMDTQLSLADNLTLQGDIYDGHIHQDLYLYSQAAPYMDEFPIKTGVSGGNIMAWAGGQKSFPEHRKCLCRCITMSCIVPRISSTKTSTRLMWNSSTALGWVLGTILSGDLGCAIHMMIIQAQKLHL